MRNFSPLPKELDMGATLARRVFQLREFRNLTIRDLSKLTRFQVRRLEDIEAGLETWLSATDRQRLAKALVVEPSLLQEVEVRSGLTSSEVTEGVHQALAVSILQGVRDLECPVCRQSLRCSIQDALDIEGRPIQFAKAFCTKCPFVLR